MRIGNNKFALLAAMLRLLTGAQGLTDGVSSCNVFRDANCHGDFSTHSVGWAYNVSQLNCTALVTVYNVATGNNTDPETFFDTYKDPYQTTGVLSLQLELGDLQLEDYNIAAVELGYNLNIFNRLYNNLSWTSNYATAALGTILNSSSNGTRISVAPFFDDNNPASADAQPGYFNMGLYSDAPKALHTYGIDVLTEALMPEQVTVNKFECEVVLACQGNGAFPDLYPC